MKARFFILPCCCLVRVAFAGSPPPPPPGPPPRSTVYPDGQCPILHLLPFNTPYDKPAEIIQGPGGKERTTEANNRLAYSYLAAAELAIRHFNQRNPVLLPQLADPNMMAKCPKVKISAQLVRSESSREAGIKSILEDRDFYENLSRPSPHVNETMIMPPPPTQSYPCAVVGPSGSHSAQITNAVTAALGIPQILVLPDADQLLGKFTHNTVGNLLSDKDRILFTLDYLASIGRSHVATFMAEHPEFQSATKMFRELGPQYSISTDMYYYNRDAAEKSTESLLSIKDSGIRTIYFGLLEANDIAMTAVLLEELGMLNGDFVFILTRPISPVDILVDVIGTQMMGSPVDKFLSGSLFIDRIDPFEVQGEKDVFLQEWKKQNASLVAAVNQMVPDDPNRIQGNDDYFQVTMPSRYSSFVYDAFMSIGLGACKAVSVGDEKVKETPPQSSVAPSEQEAQERADVVIPPPPFPPIISAIMDSSFQGASGRNVVKNSMDDQHVRDPDELLLGVFNVQPGLTNPATQLRSYDRVLTSIWEARSKEWKGIKGHKFVYGDGSFEPPPDFVISNENLLSNTVRTLGLCLLAIVWGMAFSGAFLVWYLRNDATIRAQQPVFTILLCLGSAFLATSIFTLSHDEGHGWQKEQLDRACMSTPWFFFFGQIIVFCSIFTKLWRLDRVLQFRRRRVTVREVMTPLAVLCLITLGLLLAWTFIDPWKWERDFIHPTETYGECHSDSFWAFFGPLMAVVIVAEVATIFFAKKTADVPVSLRESSQIFLAIGTQVQAWIVGVPILAVLDDSSADATYLGRVFLIWVLSMSGVAVVVWPEIIYAFKTRQNCQEACPKDRVRISGLPGEVQHSYTSGTYGSPSSRNMTHTPHEKQDTGNKLQQECPSSDSREDHTNSSTNTGEASDSEARAVLDGGAKKPEV